MRHVLKKAAVSLLPYALLILDVYTTPNVTDVYDTHLEA